MSGTCGACGRPLIARPGEMEPTCAECRLRPDWCDCQTGAGPVNAAQEWDDPVPLGASGLLPAFPVSAFPRWLADQVAETARFTQTPPDLAASAGLSVLSTAAGGRAVVEVRGSWREPVNLYNVVALPPGARKSAVFAGMTEPVLGTEAAMVASARDAILEADTLRKIALHDAEKAARWAAGIDDAEAQNKAHAEAISKALMAEGITVPVMPRLVADDITPEAVASLLAEQGGRLAVLSAEGGIFATLAGRYSSGTPNFEVFLKGHSGDMLRVDRRSRPPEYIPRPALTLGLCVQPEVLRDIARLPGFRGRGLLARILYSLPPDLVGRRRIGEPAIPEGVQAAYAGAVETLVRSLAEWTDPAVLTLTPGATALLLDAERAIEPRLDAETGDLAGIRDWASKLIGATARIAGLLHLATHPAGGWAHPVSEDTMDAAIGLGRYYTEHALAAFDHMGAEPVLGDARVILRWLERDCLTRFTRREAFTALSRSRFPKAGDLDVPLALLEDHGYIRREAEPERTGPGRPRHPPGRPTPTLPQKPRNTHNYGFCGLCGFCGKVRTEGTRSMSTPCDPEPTVVPVGFAAADRPSGPAVTGHEDPDYLSEDWAAAADAQDGRCWLCGEPLLLRGVALGPHRLIAHAACERIAELAGYDPARIERIADNLEAGNARLAYRRATEGYR